jgi:hypothetical protein
MTGPVKEPPAWSSIHHEEFMMKRSMLALLIATAVAMPFSTSAAVAVSPVMKSREQIIGFWNKDHMKEAWRVFNPPPAYPLLPPLIPGADQSGYTLMHTPYTGNPPSRITGILFWRNPATGGVGHCSAAVVRSGSQSLVLTAGHCVHDIGEPTWYDMLMFVPAYRETDAGDLTFPLGKWPVQRTFLPYEGAEQKNEDDLAVARVYRDERGAALQAIVGDSFAPQVTSDTAQFPDIQIIGYPGTWLPGDGPYDRAAQRWCYSPSEPQHDDDPKRDSSLWLRHCAPQGGNSGGPLVVVTHGHAVVGVMSSIIDGRHPRLRPGTFGPIYQAADAKP